jgi:hypothetical protein
VDYDSINNGYTYKNKEAFQFPTPGRIRIKRVKLTNRGKVLENIADDIIAPAYTSVIEDGQVG